MPSFHRMLAFAAPALTALLLAQKVRADDDLETCTTHTARPPSEIVVSMSEPPQGPTGVTIAVGETLCLAGRTDEKNVFHPWLADAHPHEPALVLLRLEASPEGKRLVTRTSLPGGLMYIVATGSRPARLATVAPDDTQRQSLDVGGQTVLLFRFRSQSVPEPLRPALHPFAPRTWELGILFSGAARRLSAGGIQDAVRTAGYRSSPRTFLGAGFDVTGAVARWRLELAVLAGGATTATSTGSVAASVADLLASVGYAFLRWRGLTGFALGGVGFTNYEIDRLPTAPGYRAGDRIGIGGSVLSLGAGFEEAVPFYAESTDGLALTFALRVGYLRQLEGSGWRDDQGNDVHGLPNVDLSGTWVTLGVGGSLYGW